MIFTIKFKKLLYTKGLFIFIFLFLYKKKNLILKIVTGRPKNGLK